MAQKAAFPEQISGFSRAHHLLATCLIIVIVHYRNIVIFVWHTGTHSLSLCV